MARKVVAIVCGGRLFDDELRVCNALDEIEQDLGVELIVYHGGATGADSAAGRWAKARGRELHVVRAKWAVFGRAAGRIRNEKMLKLAKPQLVVAFPGGVGTAHMEAIARAAGVEVIHR